MVLVDSCVLIDIFTGDEAWAPWSVSALSELAASGETLKVNPIVFSEISLCFDSVDELEQTLTQLDIEMAEVPSEALFTAARAFYQYRKRGGNKSSPLPDFFIGAHADVEGARLVTRDVRRFKTYFPNVDLICPE